MAAKACVTPNKTNKPSVYADCEYVCDKMGDMFTPQTAHLHGA